jgi:glutamine synthetase
VPWDDGVPFFLGDFVTTNKGKEVPSTICPRQILKRVLARAQTLGVTPMCGMEFEWFNFTGDAAVVGGQERRRAGADHAGHVRLFAAARECAPPVLRGPVQRHGGVRRADRGAAHRDGPGVYEAAILFSEALEQADRAVLFKTGAKEIGARYGIMPSFMAKWSQQYPGCSGHIHQSLSDGKKNLFHDAKGTHGMSRLFESYLAGQVAVAMEFAPMFWPTINSYKRLVDGFWAPVKPTWGVDNRTASFRVIAGSPKSTRLETRCPARTSTRTSRWQPSSPRGCTASRRISS